MKKTVIPPFENKIISTELFENHHWKQDMVNTMDYYNILIHVSDVADVRCRCGGERPFVDGGDLSWSFILVLEGKGKLNFPQERTFSSGALLVTPPGLGSALQITEEPFHVYRFLIQDSGALRDLFAQDISEAKVLYPSAPELLKECFERTFHLMNQQNERTPLLAAAEAFIFLSEIKRQCADRDIPEFFESVCREIACFPTRHYTLPRLAAVCRMSVRSFQRRFAKEHNCTPQTFIMVSRLAIARRILRSSTLPVQEIAVRCRFNSVAQFSKSFKKYIGMSPRAYRKKFYRKGAEYYQRNQEKNGSNLWNLLPTEGLSQLQRQIAWCMIENSHIKPKGIASQLKVPVPEVKLEMQKLQKMGVV